MLSALFASSVARALRRIMSPLQTLRELYARTHMMLQTALERYAGAHFLVHKLQELYAGTQFLRRALEELYAAMRVSLVMAQKLHERSYFPLQVLRELCNSSQCFSKTLRALRVGAQMMLQTVQERVAKRASRFTQRKSFTGERTLASHLERSPHARDSLPTRCKSSTQGRYFCCGLRATLPASPGCQKAAAERKNRSCACFFAHHCVFLIFAAAVSHRAEWRSG